MAAKRSSQKVMVWMMPLDLVARSDAWPASLGKIESVPKDPIHAPFRADRLLNGHLALRPPVDPPADLRVLTLIIFPNDHEVDVVRSPVPVCKTIPFNIRTGRKLMYCSISLRMGRSSPQSET